MGHIELAAPVVHIWFFKAMPSRLGTLLDMKTTSLEKIIYFQDYVVVDPGDTPLKERQLLTEDDFRKAREQYGDTLRGRHGRRGRQEAARSSSTSSSSRSELREKLDAETHKDKPSKQKQRDLVKRLKVVEALRDSRDNKSEWMVLECIPVIPPDLRPLVLLDSRQLRHQRPERSLSPHHQPQQPAQEAGRSERARGHHPQREADAAAVGRCPVRQQPLQAAGARLAATARSSR